MRLLDTLTVKCGSEKKFIEIYQGDLTDLTPDEAVDVLVISAKPYDYWPTPSSLIGALSRKGVSVMQLAQEKYEDKRKTCSCWMSHQIVQSHPGIQFKRIVCFETVQAEPPEAVGDIFRFLVPFMGGEFPLTSIAMPLIACGDQKFPVTRMLPPLLHAATSWMGLPSSLKRLKIVAFSDSETLELKNVFSHLKEEYDGFTLKANTNPEYDVFISYSRKNDDEASLIVRELQTLRPQLKLFYDKISIDVGMAWQKKIYDAIDNSRKILITLSPQYLASKNCMDEFNIAMLRAENLFPIYLSTAELKEYVREFQYFDCRENDGIKLRLACKELLSVI